MPYLSALEMSITHIIKCRTNHLLTYLLNLYILKAVRSAMLGVASSAANDVMMRMTS